MSLALANALLLAGGLPDAWNGQAAWRVLALGGDGPDGPGHGDGADGADDRADSQSRVCADNLGLADGLLTFLACWRLWRATSARLQNSDPTHVADPTAVAVATGNAPWRPRLHFVLILARAPDFAALREQLTGHPVDAAMAQHLIDQGDDLGPGFQRLSFDGGQVLLTLCMGELKPMLRAQQFKADCVLVWGAPLPQGAQDWDRWTAKALAQCCRPGCVVAGSAQAASVAPWLARGGFEIEPASPLRPNTAGNLRPSHSIWRGQYAPHWQIKSSRQVLATQGRAPGRCAVVGAGLAGASVAAALASRGWQVQVLDAADKPASGASGLPVGLLCPELSRDDNPRTRLSRAGLRLSLAELRRHLPEGRDWAATGVQERCLDDGTERWHRLGAWVKPQSLIQAWLSSPGVAFLSGARVASLRHSAEGWHLLAEDGRPLAEADVVVIAAAGASPQLLAAIQAGSGLDQATHAAGFGAVPLKPLLAVQGQLSWGLHPPTGGNALPPHPVNGHGHLVAQVPQGNHLAWYAGATYEHGDPGLGADADLITPAHAVNFSRLQRLLPEAAEVLRAQFERSAQSGSLGHWRNTRYASSDRMPIAGPGMAGDQPTLWVSTAMGSRGLSWAVLCAELIAARLGGEPLPIDQALARRIDSRRFWR